MPIFVIFNSYDRADANASSLMPRLDINLNHCFNSLHPGIEILDESLRDTECFQSADAAIPMFTSFYAFYLRQDSNPSVEGSDPGQWRQGA